MKVEIFIEETKIVVEGIDTDWILDTSIVFFEIPVDFEMLGYLLKGMYEFETLDEITDYMNEVTKNRNK